MNARELPYFLTFALYYPIRNKTDQYKTFECNCPEEISIDWVENSTPVKYELYGFNRDVNCGLQKHAETGELYKSGHVFAHLKTKKSWIKIENYEVKESIDVPSKNTIAQTLLLHRKVQANMIYPHFKFQ